MYGLDEISVSWFQAYLTDRQQCVQVESAVSPTLSVTHGVPQGSILGPLLFLVHFMDMPLSVDNVNNDNIINNDNDNNALPNNDNSLDNNKTDDSHVVIYADDNTPTTSHSDVDILHEKIQRDADRATSWIRDNEMICSGEKTKLLVIGTDQNRRINMIEKGKTVSLTVCGKTIGESQCEKLLGVIVNNTGTWKHMLYGNDKVGKEKEVGLIKQLSKRVGVLRRIRRYMPNDKFRMVANSLFYSKLVYCISVWGGVWNLPGVLDDQARSLTSISKDDMRKLQSLQNSVLRLQTGLGWYTSTEQLVTRANTLSVHQLVGYHTVLQAHKCRTTGEPSFMFKKLFPNTNQLEGNLGPLRSLTNENTIINFNLSLARGSFFYRASKLYNAIPPDIKSCPTVPTFKKHLRKWVHENIPVVP